MAKSFTVDVSDKQDRSFYVYVVEGDIVDVAATIEGYTIKGSWIANHGGTDRDGTITSNATGYFKTTLTVSTSPMTGDDLTITLTFPREQSATLSVDASEVEFLESKQVIVARSATPDYPINVTTDAQDVEISPEITVNENYQLTGQDDHLLTIAYIRIDPVKFASEQNPDYDPDYNPDDDPDYDPDNDTHGDEYIRTPQIINVSFSDGVVAADKNTIDVVVDANNALIDNNVKEYQLSDNQSEEKRSYTVSNIYVFATWEQGPGWYRTITYPYVWLTGADAWISSNIENWGNEGLGQCTIEYKHGTDYGYYITVPYNCSQIHLYGMVRSYGEGSEPASSSEIAWNGREFDQKPGDDCDQWIQFSAPNLTGQKVVTKLANNLGGTSYSPPIYMVFEPNPNLEETKLGELGGNTGYAGDIEGSVDFAGTGGLYDGVELDEDQEYKRFSNYHYQVSPRIGEDAIKIYAGKTTEVALLTWGNSKAENESSKFWVSVEWEAFCFDGNVALSINKQSQALSTLSIGAVAENDGDNAREYTVYVRPTKQDRWISFVVAQNPEYVNDATDEGGGGSGGGGGGGEPTYTYEILPNPAYIDAAGGTVEFTLTRNGSDGSVVTVTRTVDVPASTETTDKTITGTLTEWDQEFVYTIIQAAAEERYEVVYDPSQRVDWDYVGDVIVKVQHWIGDTLVGESKEAVVSVTEWKNPTPRYVGRGTITYDGQEFEYEVEQYYLPCDIVLQQDTIYVDWDETGAVFTYYYVAKETGEIISTETLEYSVGFINSSTSEKKNSQTFFIANGVGMGSAVTVYLIQGPAPEMEYGCQPDPGHIGAEGGYVEYTPWRKRVSNDATDYEASFSHYFSPNEQTVEVTKGGTQFISAWNYYVPFHCVQDAGTGSSSGGDTGSTTYTYTISPETATIGAEGGDVVFTLTRIGSDGSIETAIETVAIGANTTTEEVTHTGTITLWGHGFTYTIIQEAASEEEPDPDPEPEPEPDPSVTYTYTVSPETATVGADGGTITFTFTRTGSDGSEDTQTRDVTITANTTTEERELSVSVTIDDWGYTFSVTVKQDAGTASGGDEPDPDPGDEPPDVQPTSGDAHVKYMCMTQNKWTNLTNEWRLFTALTDVDVVLEASDTTDLSCAFAGSSKLVNVREDVFSNCSKALSFAYAFFYCEALKEIPAKIFSWAKQATNFNYAFAHCTSLTSAPETLFQNNTRATGFSYAFFNTAITSIPSGLFANCSKAEDFSYVFSNTKITTAPASLFYSCLNVTSFAGAFSASTMKEIPGTLFRNNTKVTNLSYIFGDCESLTSVGETLFDNCYRAENFQYAFGGCTSLSEIPDGLFKFMTSATNFATVFTRCLKLKTIPSDTFENCISAENFNAAFQSCVLLTRVRDDTFKNCAKVSRFDFAFSTCYNIFYVPQDLFCATDQLVNCNCAFANNTFLYQMGYNLYHVNENTVNILGGTGISMPYMRFLYLWNLTSEGLAEMADFTGYLPIFSSSTASEVHAYIGKIITDDDRFSKALTGNDAEEIAASTLVRTLLLRHVDRIYVGTCELGSKSFNATGYIETAGVFVSSTRTLTLPSYEDVLTIYSNNGWHSGYDGSI